MITLSSTIKWLIGGSLAIGIFFFIWYMITLFEGEEVEPQRMWTQMEDEYEALRSGQEIDYDNSILD
ncbi:hypothetical protein ACTWQB_17310, partial [Piscibacillus sp. B03]